MLVDDLQHIKVAGNDFGADSLALCAARECANDVVGLVIVEFVEWNIEGLE